MTLHNYKAYNKHNNLIIGNAMTNELELRQNLKYALQGLDQLYKFVPEDELEEKSIMNDIRSSLEQIQQIERKLHVKYSS